ncbi:MAG: hypothetical protein IJJ23_01500 [Clostridia bacterium]|nr:hypothetical protein [Clostridia bacterium]
MHTSRAAALILSLILCLTPVLALAEQPAEPAPEDKADISAANDLMSALEVDLSAANDRIAELEADLEEARDEITRLRQQRDLLLDEVRQFATDLAVARGEEAAPTFESEDLGLKLVMPTYTRLFPYNGALHIVSADGQAQGQLSLVTNAAGEAYLKDEIDPNQVYQALMRNWFDEEDIPETAPTEAPSGLRFTVPGGEDEVLDAVWLFTGERYIYCLEVLGGADSIEALFGQIAEGLTTW